MSVTREDLKTITTEDLRKLSQAELWELYGVLCDTLFTDEDAQIDSETTRELDKRLEEFRTNPENVYTHDDVVDFVRKRNSQ